MSLTPGSSVRMVLEPSRTGTLTTKFRERSGVKTWLVQFPDQSEWVPEDQLELAEDSVLDPVELIREGRLGRAADLRKSLTHIRLSGKLANVVYSMDTTNTDFFAHQFKPVLKFLNSPANGILIADEVGLGKTIEAGLIWTELRSRFDAQRLLVVCPAMLRDKWKMELRERFGVEAEIIGAKEARQHFQRAVAEGPHHSFALIGSLQGLRPRQGWTEESEDARDAGSKLATLLRDSAEQEPLVDLVIIDEAHYLRNPESMTAALGKLLRGISHQMVMLSATPIHLRSDDLFYLLRLLDEDTFTSTTVFNRILEANAPLVRAKDMLLQSVPKAEDVRALLEEARQHRLLRGNRQLATLLEEPLSDEDLDDPKIRSRLAYRVEMLNLLGHVVTRTRKREVTEWRVQRTAVAEPVSMSDEEAAFYAGVTGIVMEYASRGTGVPGFLLAMPQRQISSSMPAAFRHWKRRAEIAAEEIYDDFGIEYDQPIGPLVSEIISKVVGLAKSLELERNDSKFRRFEQLVRKFLSDFPGEKVVVFSYFRETLFYLSERLEALGITNVVLSGAADLDKTELLDGFKSPEGPRILLSSEVGAEGIDLQFCRVLINYDLPWNPMRVEQRIGRLDRLGQNAKSITIWNLYYRNTIDERIYERLYSRLRIFEVALGGLEAILGEKIQSLTSELLSGELTPQQQDEVIGQTAQAIENIRHHEEELEQQAGSLVAYGDYILNQVRAARELRRVITGADLEAYVIDFFQERYTGCSFRLIDVASRTYEIALSPEAKADFGVFLERNRLSRFSVLSRPSAGAARCRFENRVGGDRRDRAEIISQVHPLVRFVSASIRALAAKDRVFYPASALTISTAAGLDAGVYVFAVHRWAIDGIIAREDLHFEVCSMDTPDWVLDEEDAERFVVTAAMEGRDWLEVGARLNLEAASELAFALERGAHGRFQTFVKRMRSENDDRFDLQARNLADHLERQLAKLQEILGRHRAAGRLKLIPPTEGRIRKLRDNVEIKSRKLEQGRDSFTARQELVAMGVINVEG